MLLVCFTISVNTVTLIVGYVQVLMERVTEMASKGDLDVSVAKQVPQPLCAEFHRPDKEEAVAFHTTRFSSQS